MSTTLYTLIKKLVNKKVADAQTFPYSCCDFKDKDFEDIKDDLIEILNTIYVEGFYDNGDPCGYLPDDFSLKNHPKYLKEVLK